MPVVPILFTGEVVEISKNGAVFAGNFKNTDPARVTDFGFIWGLNKEPSIKNSLKYSLPLPPEHEIYSYMNDASLEEDTTYYMRTFAVYPGKNYYGNIVSFHSLGSKAPEIISIIPSSACFGDTIIITADYLGIDTSKIDVFFNEDKTVITQVNDTAIWVIVPLFSNKNSFFESEKVNVTVKKYNYQTSANDVFRLSTPRIISYTPSEGLSYNDIIVTGMGFHPERTKLFIGDQECEIIFTDLQNINALLPPLFSDYEGALTVKVINKSTTTGKVRIYSPKITHTYPNVIFSYENLYLTGNNLLNDALEIALNDLKVEKIYAKPDTLVVKVCSNLCGNELTLSLRFGKTSYVYNDKIEFRQPANFEITETKKNLFNGSFTIKADYMPDISVYSSSFGGVSINGTPANFNYHFNPDSKSELIVNIPGNVRPINEWLNVRVQFCHLSTLSIDSVFQIPVPQILHGADTLYSLSTNGISGINFNAIESENKVYIGNNLIATVIAESPVSIFFDLPQNIEAGIYPIKIITNGQESNTVFGNVVHRWEKVTNSPEELSNNAVAFLANNILYLGGGDYFTDSYKFYSYDLTTGVWSQKAYLPAKTGVCVNNSTDGYLSYHEKLYKYNFISDTWVSLQPCSEFLDATTGFLYDNKFYLFQNGISMKHFYYDLVKNEWIGFDGYSGYVECYCTPMCVFDGIYAYIFHDTEIFMFNPVDLTLSEVGRYSPRLSIERTSRIGFEYNGEAYLYSSSGWEIFDLESFRKIKKIIGPEQGWQNRVFRINNNAYFVGYSGIWKFNLEMQ
jgi:hypothetical protein